MAVAVVALPLAKALATLTVVGRPSPDSESAGGGSETLALATRREPLVVLLVNTGSLRCGGVGPPRAALAA